MESSSWNTAGETFDIVASGHRTRRRLARRRAGRLVAGVGLFSVGVALRNPIGFLVSLGGMYLIADTLGEGALRRAVKSLASDPRRAFESAVHGRSLKAKHHERVDEASWESFPASDAPAFSPVR